jgi:hypothetical protein
MIDEDNGYRCVYPAHPVEGKRPYGCVAFFYYKDGEDVIGLELVVTRVTGTRRYDLQRS